VLATGLDHAGRLPDDLLVRGVSFGATRQLRAVGQAQIEFGSVQLHHVRVGSAHPTTLLLALHVLRLFAALNVGRLAQVHAVALLGHRRAQLRQRHLHDVLLG